MLQHNVAVC